jgi:hypothetical protein
MCPHLNFNNNFNDNFCCDIYNFFIISKLYEVFFSIFNDQHTIVSRASVSSASTMNNVQSIEILADALTKIDKPKTLKVAENLRNGDLSFSTYDLIIRKADLNFEDIKKIAKTIKLINVNRVLSLHTISMSFNEDLSDENILHILYLIPKTTRVVTCVKCSFTDKAFETIINWDYEAKNL